VSDFCLEPVRPGSVIHSVELRLGFFCQRSEPSQVRVPAGGQLTSLLELYLRVLANGLEEAVTLFVPVVPGDDEGLLYQPGQEVEHIALVDRLASGDFFSSLQTPAANKNGEPPKQDLFS